MKLTVEVNGKPVQIELTADQVQQVKKQTEKITERVKTFDDACKVLGISASDILSIYDTPDDVAYKKLKVIAKALNEGWMPNWSNSNEYKYYPYFKMVGFSCDGYGYGSSASSVGSRLCYKSRELAEYAGKQFEALYKDLMMI